MNNKKTQRVAFYYETEDFIAFSQKLSAAVKKAEKEKGSSHKQIAEKIHVNVDTLSNMFPKNARKVEFGEQRKTGVASAYILYKIAEELKISPNELLGWEGETNLDRNITLTEYEILKITRNMSESSQKLLLEVAKNLESYRFIRKNENTE